MQTTQAIASQEARICIKRLRSRFERWELTHLRELAADLHARLEEAERCAHDADRRADMFMDLNHEMEAELERCGKHLGLTVAGELLLLPRTAPRLVCDDFGALSELLAAAALAEAVLAKGRWVEDSADPEAVALRALRAAVARAVGVPA